MRPYAEPVMVFLRLAGDKSSVAALKLPLGSFVLASLAYPLVPSGLQTKACRCPYNQRDKVGPRSVPPGRRVPYLKSVKEVKLTYLEYAELRGRIYQ